MRFVHSFWSSPALKATHSRLAKYVYPWLFALSASYIKHFGHEIVLYTDTEGAKMLDTSIYDDVVIMFDNLDINPKFFAYPKFLTYEKEGTSSVYIDGDIIIKSPVVISIINLAKTLAVYTREGKLEQCDGNRDTIKYFYKLINGTEPILLKEYPKAWLNTGILYIKDDKLFDEYIKGYFDYYNKYKDIITPTKDMINIVPDLIIEQQWLHDLAAYRNCKHIDVLTTVSPNRKGAASLLVHYLGYLKYLLFNEVRQSLQYIFPSQHQSLTNTLRKNGLLLSDSQYAQITDVKFMQTQAGFDIKTE